MEISPTLKSASVVHNPAVDRLELARYYLGSELPNIIESHDSQVTQAVHHSIGQLQPHQVWRLLEALSYTFRINGVFSAVSDEGFDWKEVSLPTSAITLSGTQPHINDIVYSDEIQRDPQKFARYLNTYFTKYPQPNDDPKGLNEFRPRDHTITHDTLMTLERYGNIEMLDGTHRLIAMAMNGVDSIRCFSAILNGKPRRSRRGDSTFETLQKAYAHMPNHREAILEVTEALARQSLDGIDAIARYWVAHPRDPELKSAGQTLLDRVKATRASQSPRQG